MKKILLLLSILISFKAHAQQGTIFTIDSLSHYPNYLNENWKFIDGDSPQYALPSYNDSAALKINTILYQIDSESAAFNGIGWFRFHFHTDTSITDQHLALSIWHYGASELYIDGKLIKKFGVIAGKNSSVYYDPQEIPFVFTLKDTGEHLLAVRYENYNATYNAATYHHLIAGFKIMIGKADSLIYQKNLRSTIFTFVLLLLCGIFLALSMLHLFMYLYNKSEKSNLSFSIFMFCLATVFINSFILSVSHTPTIELLSAYTLIPVLTISCLSLSRFINTLFAKKKGIRYWIITTIGVTAMLLGLMGADIYPEVAITLIITVSIEAIITVIIAMYRKVKGASIIGAGILFLTLFILTVFLMLVITGDNIELNDGTTGGQLLIVFLTLAVLSTPFSMSVYQAWRYAKMNKELEQQLENVKQLSQKTIDQEQEKQRLLEGRKEELEHEVKLRTDELKESQAQLVQQEKLASLGALTAGIAHEIKNPLNFVNNFSELSAELVDEFINAKDDEERNDIGKDLKLNLSKINEHGKRADSIVKNMLEHSRTGKSEKQMVDINKLCEEDMSLAYHGMRATNQEFNCTLEKNLAVDLPQINVVAQDINRVILNLLTNAFYAVGEKKNSNSNYNPVVSVSTQQFNNSVKIAVRDNGNGIPSNIKEKIFEPFFTTKPTGQGTGLGLSMSNDIIKAHGGELKVISNEQEFTEFIITLPISS